MSFLNLLLFVSCVAAQSLNQASFSSSNTCLKRSVLVYTSDSSTYFVTDIGTSSFSSTPTFCPNVSVSTLISTVYGSDQTVTSNQTITATQPASTVTVYRQSTSVQQTVASEAPVVAVITDNSFEDGTQSPFNSSASVSSVTAEVMQGGPYEAHTGDNYLLIMFNQTAPAQRRLRRQSTDSITPLVYNVTQVFAATAGATYILSAWAAELITGDDKPVCSITICADSSCGTTSPLTTNYTGYSYPYQSPRDESSAIATFSIQCDQSAYVALDDVAVLSHDAAASSAQALVTATTTVTRTETVVQSQVLTQIETTTYISGSEVVLTTTVPTLVYMTATVNQPTTEVYNITRTVSNVILSTATATTAVPQYVNVTVSSVSTITTTQTSTLNSTVISYQPSLVYQTEYATATNVFTITEPGVTLPASTVLQPPLTASITLNQSTAYVTLDPITETVTPSAETYVVFSTLNFTASIPITLPQQTAYVSITLPPVTETQLGPTITETYSPSVAAATSSTPLDTSTPEEPFDTPTPSGDNVVSCTSTQAGPTYYVQVDGTGLSIDGTVMMGPNTAGDGSYQSWFAPPGSFDDPWAKQNFTYDSDSLQLYNEADNLFEVYNYQQDRPGSIWWFFSGYSFGVPLLCTVVSEDMTLDCSATVNEVSYRGLQVVSLGGDGYYPYLAGLNSGGINGTFRLVERCAESTPTAAALIVPQDTLTAAALIIPQNTPTPTPAEPSSASAAATSTPNLFILQSTGDQSLYITVDDTGALRLVQDTSTAVPFFVDASGQLHNWYNSSKLLVDYYEPDSSTANDKVYNDVPSRSNYGLTCSYYGSENGDFWGQCQASGPPDGNPVVYGFGTCPNEGYYVYMIPNDSNVKCWDGGYSFLGFYLVTYTGTTSAVTSSVPQDTPTSTPSPAEPSYSSVYVPAPTDSNVPAIALARPTAIVGDVNGAPDDVDDEAYPVSLPVSITMYGQSSSNVRVSSNGLFGLTDLDNECTNEPLPYYGDYPECAQETSENEYGNVENDCFGDTVASGLWDDLYIYQGTQQGIYYEVDGAVGSRQTTFEFYISHYDDDNQYYHFLMKFYENRPNIVTYQYLNVSDYGNSATVGVESYSAGQLYSQYSYNQAVICPGLQLTFDTSTGNGTYTVDSPGDCSAAATSDSEDDGESEPPTGQSAPLTGQSAPLTGWKKVDKMASSTSSKGRKGSKKRRREQFRI